MLTPSCGLSLTRVSEAILVQKISTLERVSSELQLGMNAGTRPATQQEHFALGCLKDWSKFGFITGHSEVSLLGSQEPCMPLPALYFQHFLIRIQEPSESSRIVLSSRHQPLFPQVDEHFGRVRQGLPGRGKVQKRKNTSWLSQAKSHPWKNRLFETTNEGLCDGRNQDLDSPWRSGERTTAPNSQIPPGPEPWLSFVLKNGSKHARVALQGRHMASSGSAATTRKRGGCSHPGFWYGSKGLAPKNSNVSWLMGYALSIFSS